MALALNPSTGGTSLVYRSVQTNGATAEKSIFVSGSTEDRTAIRLDRSSLSGPVNVNLSCGFSIALRVRVDGQGSILGDAGASNGTVVALGNGYTEGFRITADTTSRRLHFSIGRPISPHSVTVSSPPIPYAQWLHVAATWDGRVMRLYLDGWLVAERVMTNSYTPPSRPTFTIGYAGAGVGSLNMVFERADLFTSALPPSACLRLMSPATTPTAAFVELWDKVLESLHQRDDFGGGRRSDEILTAAAAEPAPFRAAASRMAAEVAARQGDTAGAAVAYIELLNSPASPSTWRNQARDELRRFIREGAAATWPASLHDQLERAVPLERVEQMNLWLSQLSSSTEAGDTQQALKVAGRILDAPDVDPATRSTALLALARLAREANDLPRMREYLRAVLVLQNAPLSHRDEAERLLAYSEAGPIRDRLPSLPVLPTPAIELFVAPDGRDSDPGTRELPLASPAGARDALRRLRRSGTLPAGGATIWFSPGHYSMRTTLTLDARDSGAVGAPVVWRALDPTAPPVFDGGIRLRATALSADLRRVANPEFADRLIEFDLAAHGLTNLPPFVLGGFASGHGFRTYPTLELFARHTALPRSRWPNHGWVSLIRVLGTNPILAHGRPTGAVKEGILGYDGDRPARWTEEPALFLHGYWHHRWADSYESVAAIDPSTRQIRLTPPWHTYGFRTGGLWSAVNAVSEIDQPGEWALVPQLGRIVALPPTNADSNTEWVVSACLEPMLQAQGLSHCAFIHLTWQYGAHDALLFRAATNLFIAGCTVRHFAGDALRLDGGQSNVVRSCDVYSIGRGGIYVGGGDRRTLTPGGHQILNCHLHHLSRLHPTYTPAISLAGVGHRVAHCLMHDIRSSALRVAGNDHLIEMNEICHVVTESDDQGGADMWGDPTYRGNRFLHNFWHHIGRQPGEALTAEVGRAAIRLDDAISGVLIRGNVFLRCGAGTKNLFGSVQIHGGKDNEVDSNIIVLAPAALSFSPWSKTRWNEFITRALEKPEINREVFFTRYPSLARLADDPNQNLILRNFIWRCDMLSWRSPDPICWVNNAVSADPDTPFLAPDRGDFRLKPGRRPPGTLGPEPIPFAMIGLRPDSFRPSLPTNLIHQLRTR